MRNRGARELFKNAQRELQLPQESTANARLGGGTRGERFYQVGRPISEDDDDDDDRGFARTPEGGEADNGRIAERRAKDAPIKEREE